MKLSGAELGRFCARPAPDCPGLLIHGSDAMRVALRRQEVVAALAGPAGESEMRVTRIAASDLRKDPAALADAMRARGFFEGPRVVLVEDAADSQADAIRAALTDWAEGDAVVVVTAGQLPARAALRKFFEGDRRCLSVAIYDDPPGRDEIEQMLNRAGLGRLDGEAMAAITALSRALDPGDLRQTIDKVGLYKWGDETPLTTAELAMLAPQSTEARIDDLLNAVAEGGHERIGPALARLTAQGVNPVTLCIAAARHFRALLTAASDPGGVGAGLARLRPPVFGPRRDAMARQAGALGRRRLETAVQLLVDCDLSLRSGQVAPQMALMERTLIRLAMLARR